MITYLYKCLRRPFALVYLSVSISYGMMSLLCYGRVLLRVIMLCCRVVVLWVLCVVVCLCCSLVDRAFELVGDL
jgi:hypothetical protein